MTTTVVHCKNPHDILIDRTTPWGNIYSHLPSSLAEYRVNSREEACLKFETWVLDSDNEKAIWIRENVHKLKDKVLGCWCHPKRCHGETLAKMADGTLIYNQGSLF